MATFQVGEIAIVNTPEIAPELHNRLCEVTGPLGDYFGADTSGRLVIGTGYRIHVVGEPGEHCVKPHCLRKLGESEPEQAVPREEIAHA